MTAGAEIVMVIVCVEPQHDADKLRAFREHGSEWVECLTCGRQWAVDGSHAELVTDGDGYCDEHADGAA